MEVKIGVQHTPREISLESTQTADEVRALVAEALKSEAGLLSLADEKGRLVLIPSKLIGYVEIAESDTRRVGFLG